MTQTRRPLSRPAKIALLLLTNIGILCGLLYGFEYYLRLTDPFLTLPFDTSYYERYQPYYEALGRPAKPLAHEQYTWGQVVATNQFDFRERDFTRPKPADVCRVLVLGDSFTWGTGLGLAERYTNRVEQQLNETFPKRHFELLSLAYSGAATVGERDFLHNFKDLLQPDLIVVGFVSNDPQPRRQNYTLEKEQFDETYGPSVEALSRGLIRLGLIQTAKTAREAVDNLIVKVGLVPAWEVGLQRTYEPDSAEWQAFQTALAEIKAMSDEMKLPPPLFVVLNQAVFWAQPTDYRELDPAWPIYLQWYHRAEQAAAASGFRTYNHERELLEQINPVDIPLNVLDNHPSAKVNHIYAQKLFETLTADISNGTLCPPGRAHGALPAAADVPLAPQRLLSVKLGETIRFWGYRADVTQLEPEKIISLTFGWQALAELKTNYTILITVLDETGQVWAKQESLPCQSACQTIFWPAGMLAPPGAEIIYWPDSSPDKLSPLPLVELPYQGEFRDVHLLKLPAEIPRGRYRLILGLVAPSGEQLPAYDEIAQKELAEGQIPLGFIVVE